MPITVKPADDPVFFSKIPLVAPFELMLLNVSPAAPIVVFWTLSAVPVVLVIVLFDPSTRSVALAADVFDALIPVAVPELIASPPLEKRSVVFPV